MTDRAHFCDQCGTRIESSAAYCDACGAAGHAAGFFRSRRRFRDGLILVLATVAVLAGMVGHGALLYRNTAAVVDGERITTRELDQAVRERLALLEKSGRAPGPWASFRYRVLEELVDQRVLEASAARRGIRIAEADIDWAVKRFRARKGLWDGGAFARFVAETYGNDEGLRRAVRRDLAFARLASLRTPAVQTVSVGGRTAGIPLRMSDLKKEIPVMVHIPAPAEKGACCTTGKSGGGGCGGGCCSTRVSTASTGPVSPSRTPDAGGFVRRYVRAGTR